MRLLFIGAMGFALLGCQVTGTKPAYGIDCVIVKNADGTRWEKCEEYSVNEILTVCGFDEDGKQYETEASEVDVAALLNLNPKNYVGHCNEPER
jgi:hypothetical protein